MALINRPYPPEWQPRGLDYSHERLVVVIGRPASVCRDNAVYIGPTSVDWMPIEEHEAEMEKMRRQQAREAAIHKREKWMLNRWRLEDDRYYRGPGRDR